MQQKNSYTFLHYLCSRAALLNVVIPVVLYNGALYLFNIDVAMLASAIWACIIAIQSKNRKATLSVALMILLAGACHYLFVHHPTWLPVQREDAFLSLSSATTVVVVFLFYSLCGQPVIQTLAEQARPQLTEMSIYGSPAYLRVWQEISLTWIVIYLLKAISVYILYHSQHGSLLNYFLLFASWPLMLFMIFFSVRWPRYRWHTKVS